MEYSQVSNSDLPLELLLEADPSQDVIESYLPGSWCFAATAQNSLVAGCVVKQIGDRKAEILNISVFPRYQQKGIGSDLLRFVLTALKAKGISEVELCTGTFGYQLTFYQRLGFRVCAVEKDYFLTHYVEPIFEDGIQHKDRLRLYLAL